MTGDSLFDDSRQRPENSKKPLDGLDHLRVPSVHTHLAYYPEAVIIHRADITAVQSILELAIPELGHETGRHLYDMLCGHGRFLCSSDLPAHYGHLPHYMLLQGRRFILGNGIAVEVEQVLKLKSNVRDNECVDIELSASGPPVSHVELKVVLPMIDVERRWDVVDQIGAAAGAPHLSRAFSALVSTGDAPDRDEGGVARVSPSASVVLRSGHLVRQLRIHPEDMPPRRNIGALLVPSSFQCARPSQREEERFFGLLSSLEHRAFPQSGLLGMANAFTMQDGDPSERVLTNLGHMLLNPVSVKFERMIDLAELGGWENTAELNPSVIDAMESFVGIGPIETEMGRMRIRYGSTMAVHNAIPLHGVYAFQPDQQILELQFEGHSIGGSPKVARDRTAFVKSACQTVGFSIDLSEAQDYIDGMDDEDLILGAEFGFVIEGEKALVVAELPTRDRDAR